MYCLVSTDKVLENDITGLSLREGEDEERN